jgi:hypothetical protein
MPMTPLEIATKLLVHFDEASGTFVDSSIYGRPETARVGFAPDTIAKFGARSAGNSDSTIQRRVTFGPALRISSSIPWSIDFWARPTAFNPSGGVVIWNGYSVFARPGIGLTPDGRIYVLRNDNLNSRVDSVSTTPLTLDEWQHVAISHNPDGTLRIFLDGADNGVFTTPVSSDPFSGVDFDFSVGGDSFNAAPSFVGQIDEVRVVIGFPQFGGPFTRPTAPYANPVRDLSYGSLENPARLPGNPKPAANFKAGPDNPRIVEFDRNFGGTGMIVGTVKEKSTPTNTPLARKVRLYHEFSGRFVRETWSDSVTGNYAFPNLDRTQRFTVVTYDNVNNYRAVIADNMLPEPM